MEAMKGPVPKPGRARTNKDTYTVQKVIYRDNILRGPELGDGYMWNERTLEWWDMWRRSPMAQLMEETDWETLRTGAMLHTLIWEAGISPANVVAASKELGRICSAYGLTYADRLRLRIRIADEPLVDAEVANHPSNVKKISDYRSLVGVA